MGTFQRTETVDARRFIGGKENGTNLALWVNTHGQTTETRAYWREAYSAGSMYTSIPERVRVRSFTLDTDVYVGDWIILTQEGHFEHLRPEAFIMAGYVQV